MHGEVVRMARERRGVSVAELARRTGFAATEIVAIESGRHQPGAERVRLLLGALLASPGSPLVPAGDFDDKSLLERAHAMSMSARLESGFALCRFASELAGTARV